VPPPLVVNIRRTEVFGTAGPCLPASLIEPRRPVRFLWREFHDPHTLAVMIEKILFCLKLLLVLLVIILFGQAIQYLIFNGGFSGSFLDIIFFRQ